MRRNWFLSCFVVLCLFAVGTSSSPPGGIVAKQDVTIELYYGGMWNTVEAYVRDPVRITRGHPEGAEPTPATATLTLKGFINPQSPLSPLYGLAGQNTPIRIPVDTSTRFYGEVSSWKPERTLDHNPATGMGDAWTAITASGILRRLGQGADPVRSAHYRAITQAGTALGHWSLEDPERSTVAQSSVVGVDPASPVTEARYTTADGTDIPPGGAPKFGVGIGPAGSAKLVDVTAGGTLEGLVPAGGTGWTVEFVFRMLPGAADGSTSVDIFRWYETGKYGEFIVNVTQAGVTVFHEDPISGDDGSADAAFNVYDGTSHHFRYTTSQSGGNYLSRLYIDGNLMATADNFGSAMAGTIGQVNRWTLNPLEARGDEMPAAFGQVVVWPSATPPTGLVEAAFGHQAEAAGVRFGRLCDEEDIPYTIVGTDTDTQPMGVQPRETLPDLFADLERTDDAILFEPRDAYGLALRTGRDRYNQDPVLVLDYAANEVAPPLQLVLDDLSTRNDVTVNRRDGGEAQAVLETGPLSVLEPPDGIGRYATKVDVNTATVDVLPDHAWWHLSKGTTNGVRYARVVVDLDAKPALVADVEAVDIGDVIALDNLPADEATGRVRLLVLLINEVIGSHRRVVTFDCIPATPYDIGVWGSDAKGSRFGARTTFLAEDLTSVETAVDVDTGTDTWIKTSSHPTRFPLDVTIGGLVYSCTAITGTHPNLTLTIVRLATDKTHTTGDQVTVTDTGRYGL